MLYHQFKPKLNLAKVNFIASMAAVAGGLGAPNVEGWSGWPP